MNWSFYTVIRLDMTSAYSYAKTVALYFAAVFFVLAMLSGESLMISAVQGGISAVVATFFFITIIGIHYLILRKADPIRRVVVHSSPSKSIDAISSLDKPNF